MSVLFEDGVDSGFAVMTGFLIATFMVAVAVFFLAAFAVIPLALLYGLWLDVKWLQKWRLSKDEKTFAVISAATVASFAVVLVLPGSILYG